MIDLEWLKFIDYLKIELETRLQNEQKFIEAMETITSWTCNCNCVTFDNKICRRCGSTPKYGNIDYKAFKELAKEYNLGTNQEKIEVKE